MSWIGREVEGFRIVAPTQVPEGGAWYDAVSLAGGGQSAIRVGRDDGVHEDPNAVRMCWERLRHMDHPGIPRVLRYVRDPQVLVLASRPSVPLMHVLEHRAEAGFEMTPATLLDLALQLVEALLHAHERGRPHGHLSPYDVLLSADGTLQIWGFGDGPDAMPDERWICPERAQGRRSSGDADQWAVGAILAAMITGRVPWRSAAPLEEARVGDTEHLSKPVLEQWKPLGRLLARMLAPGPAERFSSLHPIRQALRALAQRVPQPSTMPALSAQLLKQFGPEALPRASELPRAEAAVVGQRPPDDVPTVIAYDLPPVVPLTDEVESGLPIMPDFQPGPSPSAMPSLEPEPVVYEVPGFADFAPPTSPTILPEEVERTPARQPERREPEPQEFDPRAFEELAPTALVEEHDGPSLGDVSVASPAGGPSTQPSAGNFGAVPAVERGRARAAASLPDVAPSKDVLGEKVPVLSERPPSDTALDIRGVAPWIVAGLVLVMMLYFLQFFVKGAA